MPDNLPGPAPAEQLLGGQHRLGGERAPGGALRIGESQDDDLAAERAQGDLLAELVCQPEVGRHDAAERRAGIEVRVRCCGRVTAAEGDRTYPILPPADQPFGPLGRL